MTRPRVLVVLALTLLSLLSGAGEVWAHRAPAPEPAALGSPPPDAAVSTGGDEAWSAGPAPELGAALAPAAPGGGPGPVAVALVLATAGVAALRACSRRSLAAGLVPALCVFVFEGAVHSVHHLMDVSQGADCVVAMAAAQTGAADLGAAPSPPPAPPAGREVAAASQPLVSAPCLSLARGRAPPAPLV